MSKEVKILLTGFGSFGSVVNNPTERLVSHFAQLRLDGIVLKTALLPVSYTDAPRILKDAIMRGWERDTPFDLIWMLGVAAVSPFWRVEQWGHNQNDPAPDRDGISPPSRISPQGPASLPVTIPVELVTEAVRSEGLPAHPSDTAGGYLCNHALYSVLWELRQNDAPTRAGFLHVPADTQTFAAPPPDIECFSFDAHIAAVTASLHTLRTEF